MIYTVVVISVEGDPFDAATGYLLGLGRALKLKKFLKWSNIAGNDPEG